ncbi:MAG TPA: hypothetical protein VFV50_12805 [Bdellovibrionales bacterium]|nr:hypothetical protein [Bdellovibrionales bacterium]
MPKAREFVQQVEGKRFKLTKYKSIWLSKGEVKSTQEMTAEQYAERALCQRQAAGKSEKIPCDHVMGFTINDEKNATVVTQQSAAVEMRTRYTLNKDKELELQLIEVGPKDGVLTVNYRMKGRVSLSEAVLTLVEEKQLHGENGEPLPEELFRSSYAFEAQK